MSWFRHKPSLKTPPSPRPARRGSPISDKLLQETKEKVKNQTSNNKDSKSF